MILSPGTLQKEGPALPGGTFFFRKSWFPFSFPTAYRPSAPPPYYTAGFFCLPDNKPATLPQTQPMNMPAGTAGIFARYSENGLLPTLIQKATKGIGLL